MEQQRAIAELYWSILDGSNGPIGWPDIDITAKALQHEAKAELMEFFRRSPTTWDGAARLLLERSGAHKKFSRSLAAGAGILLPEDGRALAADLLQSLQLVRAVDPNHAKTIESAVALFLARRPPSLDQCIRALHEVEATLCRLFIVLGAWGPPRSREPMSDWRHHAEAHARASAACAYLRGSFKEPVEPAQKVLH